MQTQVEVATKVNGRANGIKGFRRVPANGQYFVGCLVGGYRDTRERIALDLLKDFGIDCRKNHFGLEQKTHSELFIAKGVEIVLVLHNDVLQMMPRIVKACEAVKVEYIEITRKQHTWAPALTAKGFTTPPSWRDGFDIDKLLASEKLDHIEPPRLAYEDPQLKAKREKQEREAALNPLPPAPPPEEAPKKMEKPAKPTDGTTRVAFQNFSKAVIEARRRTGQNLKKFAEKLDLSSSSVDNWELLRGNMPIFSTYYKLNAKWPDLFPPVTGLIGEKKAQREGLRFITKLVEKVPAPAPYVPPTKEAKAALAKHAPEPPTVEERLKDASIPLFVPKAPPQLPALSGNVLDDYVAAVLALKAADATIAAAHAARAEALARVNDLHRQVTGQ